MVKTCTPNSSKLCFFMHKKKIDKGRLLPKEKGSYNISCEVQRKKEKDAGEKLQTPKHFSTSPNKRCKKRHENTQLWQINVKWGN